MSGSENEQRTPVGQAEGTDHHDSHHHHEHHEHHEHRHHHQSRQKKKRRYRNKIVGFVLERKKQFAGVIVFLVVLIALIVMIFMESAANREAQGALLDGTGATSEQSQRPVELSDLTVQLPWLPEELPLVSDAVQALMDADPATTAVDVLSSFRGKDGWLDVGVPAQLSFDVLSVPEEVTISSFLVEVWQEDAPDQIWSFQLKARERSVQIPHLETGAQYQYRITVSLSDGSSNGITGSFRTMASPRILTIGGVRNVRDIGGWETTSGKTIRQGLLYRGSEMDGVSRAELTISDEGRQIMLTQLGIRTDMDLRDPDVGREALGANVRHTCYGAAAYMDIFTAEGGESVRKVFEDLADVDAYPVYLHCDYGADQTGTICYLLEALLGVSEEDLIREFELTALCHETFDRQRLQSTIDQLKTFEGVDMQENVELYLQSVGVTREQIDTIRSVFLP